MAWWERYSAGLPSASLELRVAQRALRDGCSAKEVALMLVAGSETVKLIYDRQGRKEAIAFTGHIIQMASNQQKDRPPKELSMQSQHIELGDD